MNDGSAQRAARGGPNPESVLMDEIRLALSDPDAVFWRNNIGIAEIRSRPGARPQVVRFGVGSPGGADLIGLFRGRFVAVEVKTPAGRQSKEQRLWQQLVERKGGVYAIVRSATEATALLERLRREIEPARTDAAFEIPEIP
jgi:hypothetical protein